MTDMWPFYLHISEADLVKLVQYQERKYHQRLDVLSLPEARGWIDTEIESPEEIDKLMRQAPRHQKRVV